MKNSKILFVLIVVALVVVRTMFGLCAEFWFEDELQIYLIGLKSYTTQTWPSYGPDVVYTNTQIPGALQGWLVRLPLEILPIPEGPALFLNVLCSASLLFFAWYIYKRLNWNFSPYLIFYWILLLSWTVDYGTRVVNPSYVLIFSIPFFVSIIELLPIYPNRILNGNLAALITGVCITCIMQLHLSFVLLLPFLGISFFFIVKQEKIKHVAYKIGSLLIGLLVGALTLLPTYFNSVSSKNVSENIVFNASNILNLPIILLRYLSFASFEIPYFLGGSTKQRLAVIEYSIWSTPFVIYLLLFGFLMVGGYLLASFKFKKDVVWFKIKLLTLLGYLLVFCSFFFSIKGPSSHTFFIMAPLVIFFSMHCHVLLIEKYKWWLTLMKVAMVSAVFLYASVGYYNYHHKSLYKNRAQVVKAIEEKNYQLLGKRRSDSWGYGY
ncbi:MAG: hypothetical protein IPO27_13060 [Bacteroidetes bacterium]|nr:hypothetical protein [Bacteroidota bacterium]